MPKTYNPALLASTPFMQVRLALGDTESPMVLDDAEIALRLTEHAQDVNAAAIACGEDILARLAHKTDLSGPGIATQHRQRVESFRLALDRLRAKVRSTALPFVGGRSKTRETSLRQATDFTGRTTDSSDWKNQRD